MTAYKITDATGRIIATGRTGHADDLPAVPVPDGCTLEAVTGPLPALDPLPVSLEAARRKLSRRLDEEAERQRLLWVTAGAGQAMTYLAKEAEARALLAGSTDPTPFLDAEADAMGLTVAALAASVVTQSDAWRGTIGPAIEARRKVLKAAIAAAADQAALDVIDIAAGWPA